MIKEKLNPQHAQVLADYGLQSLSSSELSVFHFKKNEYLLRQGHAGEYLLLMLSGRIKVFITSPGGKALLFCFYTTSGILGEAEFATGADVAAMSVQAVSDVACIAIPLSRYREMLKQNVVFMSFVSAALAGKLFRCTRNSAVTILYSLESRLCAYITMISEDGVFREKLTEVSEMLGTSYRHLLRTLTSLCDHGVLRKEGRSYVVADAAALKQKGEDYYVE